MSWHLMLGQLPGTLLLLAIMLAGAAGCYLLGAHVERDDVQREIRAGRLVVVPDDVELERLMAPYFTHDGHLEQAWRTES